MKRIAFFFSILLLALSGLVANRSSAFQEAAIGNDDKAKSTPMPSVKLPPAALRRDFKNSLPIPAGEKLEYEVRFSRFPIYATVGVISFEFAGAATTPTIDGLNVEFNPAPENQFLRLRATAISKGFLIALTGVDVKDRFETLVDAKDFAARIGFKQIKEGKKNQAQALVFDSSQQTVRFITNDLNNAQAPPKEKAAPRENGMLDLLSAIYFVRLQKMKEGQLIRFPVNDDGTNYWFDIVVGKTEKLNTDCGKVKTIRLEPKIFGPGQLISRQGEMTMWVTADDKHVPLKITAKTASGTVHAKLQNFKNKCKLIDEEAEQKPTSKRESTETSKSIKSTILPESEAKRIAHPCSRPGPPEFSATWQPSEADIKAMEAKLSLIKQLKAKCCMEGAQVSNLNNFYLQYVGIVVKGRHLIYINAFSHSGTSPEYWKQIAMITCDGGNDWGVLYDPQSEKFFDLSINGVG